MATQRKLEVGEQFNETSGIRWKAFFEILNAWFKRTASVQTGLESHEAYLKEKLGLADSGGQVKITSEIVYAKNKATGYSFWEWISAIAEYVQKFPHYWESGLILGFASRAMVEQVLHTATQPSMVLKFSDSRPGKIVVSYISWIDGREILEHILFDDEEHDSSFSRRTLTECIKMSMKLRNVQKILPSNKPVQELFELDPPDRPARSTKRNDGYVSPTVAIDWK